MTGLRAVRRHVDGENEEDGRLGTRKAESGILEEVVDPGQNRSITNAARNQKMTGETKQNSERTKDFLPVTCRIYTGGRVFVWLRTFR